MKKNFAVICKLPEDKECPIKYVGTCNFCMYAEVIVWKVPDD